MPIAFVTHPQYLAHDAGFGHPERPERLRAVHDGVARAGLEGEVVTLQDLFIYDIFGEDSSGRVSGQHRTTGIARPHFWDKARYFNEDKRLSEILSAAEMRDEHGRPLGERVAQS